MRACSSNDPQLVLIVELLLFFSLRCKWHQYATVHYCRLPKKYTQQYALLYSSKECRPKRMIQYDNLQFFYETISVFLIFEFNKLRRERGWLQFVTWEDLSWGPPHGFPFFHCSTFALASSRRQHPSRPSAPCPTTTVDLQHDPSTCAEGTADTLQTSVTPSYSFALPAIA